MVATLDSGKCRHLIELQKPIEREARDSKGHRDLRYETVIEAYASIEQTTSQENLDKQVRSESTHRFTLWWMHGIEASWRIKWGSRFFHIDDAENVNEENSILELHATEKR